MAARQVNPCGTTTLPTMLLALTAIDLSKRDIMRLLNDHKVSLPTLKKMAAVDALIQVKELELNKLKELQTAISRST